MEAGSARTVIVAVVPLAAAFAATALLGRFTWWLAALLALTHVAVFGIPPLRAWRARPRDRSGNLPPSNLPAPPTNLIGRAADAAALSNHLIMPKLCGPRLAVVSGEPGIGKTAFALHVAHGVAENFTAGELFARYDPADRHIVRKVRQRLISALSRPGDVLPPRISQQRRQYRRLIRRLNARNQLLVVFDDVRDADQVRAVLPRSRWCAVIVTTRTRLSGLPETFKLPLEPLQRIDAVEMLGAIIGPRRVEAERAFAGRIVTDAAYRPLAVHLVGMALANRPNIRLSVAYNRMMTSGDQSRDDSRDTALDLSYAMLTKGEQEALVALGLLESHYRFAPWELAALLVPDKKLPERTEREAWQLCDRLTDAGLLERYSPDAVGVQEFRLLERVEIYANQLAGRLLPGPLGAERKQALRAQRKIRQQPWPHPAGEVFERLNKIYESGQVSRAFKEARNQIARSRDNGDAAAEAEATVLLAELHAELGGYEDVDDLLRMPLAAEHAPARYRALRIRARVRRRLRQLDRAGDDLAAARGLAADAQDRIEEIRRMQEAAIIESLGPNPERGLKLLDDADVLSQEHRQQLPGLAYARSRVLLSLDRPGDARREAEDGHRQAVETEQELWATWLLFQQGVCRHHDGRQKEATRLARQAMEDFSRRRHRYGAAHCRMLLGRSAFAQRDFRWACAFFGEALETFRYCDDTWVEAEAAEYLGRALPADTQRGAREVLFLEAQRLYATIGAEQQVRDLDRELLNWKGR